MVRAMLNVGGSLVLLVVIALFLFALYWVIRAGVAAGMRSALPDSALRPPRSRR